MIPQGSSVLNQPACRELECYRWDVGPVLMIVNRQAGRRGVRRDADRAAERLKERGVAVDLQATSSAEEAAGIIDQAKSGYSCVVAVGGDGTLRGVVEAAKGVLPVGLIPRGTANVVARELSLPLDPRRAADNVAAGHIRNIDLGHIEGRGTFLAMVGVGFDGKVVNGVPPGRMKVARMGLAALGALLRPNLPRLAVTMDGVPVDGGAFGVVAANTRNYAGWFVACPAAQPDDGVLDTMILHRGDRRALLRFGLAVARRREGSPRVISYGRSSQIEIESLSEFESPVQADGDPCGTTPVTLSIEPGAVAIIAPDMGGAR